MTLSELTDKPLRVIGQDPSGRDFPPVGTVFYIREIVDGVGVLISVESYQFASDYYRLVSWDDFTKVVFYISKR